MLSRKDGFGMDNLPLKLAPDKTPRRDWEIAPGRWHPTPPGFGAVTVVWSSPHPDAGQSDGVSQIHQVGQFAGVDPDDEKDGEDDDEP
jgi:hypothetical protein